MDRRAFLRGVAALGAGGALAGCTGGEEVPETAPPPPPAVQTAAEEGESVTVGGEDRDGGPVTVDDPVEDPEGANSIILVAQDSFPGDDDGLVVTITVGNEGVSRAVALVEVTVDAGDEELVLERFVDLNPGETRRIRFTPEVTYDDYSGHVPRVLPETPATLIPSPTPSPTPSDTATPTPTATATDTDASDETTQ